MEKEITRKSIFLNAWKSKIGYSLNYKDFDELETIIDYYETQVKKQQEINKKAIKYMNHHWVIDDPVRFKNDLLQILEDKEV